MIAKKPTSRIPKSTPYLMVLASCGTVSDDLYIKHLEYLTYVTPIPVAIGPIIEIVIVALRKILPPENCHRWLILFKEIGREKK